MEGDGGETLLLGRDQAGARAEVKATGEREGELAEVPPPGPAPRDAAQRPSTGPVSAGGKGGGGGVLVLGEPGWLGGWKVLLLPGPGGTRQLVALTVPGARGQTDGCGAPSRPCRSREGIKLFKSGWLNPPLPNFLGESADCGLAPLVQLEPPCRRRVLPNPSWPLVLAAVASRALP